MLLRSLRRWSCPRAGLVRGRRARHYLIESLEQRSLLAGVGDVFVPPADPRVSLDVSASWKFLRSDARRAKPFVRRLILVDRLAATQLEQFGRPGRRHHKAHELVHCEHAGERATQVLGHVPSVVRERFGAIDRLPAAALVYHPLRLIRHRTVAALRVNCVLSASRESAEQP
jgi:hypothetical protein